MVGMPPKKRRRKDVDEELEPPEPLDSGEGVNLCRKIFYISGSVEQMVSRIWVVTFVQVSYLGKLI